MAESSASSRSSNAIGGSSSTVEKGKGLNGLQCLRHWNACAAWDKSVQCHYGREAQVWTSMIGKNPAIRFRRCAMGDRYGFWQWVDPPICETANRLIHMIVEEMVEMRNTSQVHESLVFNYEDEVRRCNEELWNVKQELAQLKARKIGFWNKFKSLLCF